MARVLRPEIPLEQMLAQQIYDALQGDVIQFVLEKADEPTDDDYWRSQMEGHCMKVEEKVFGKFYRLCHEVMDKLGFNEPVDFYVTGDASINAFSVSAEGKDHHHIVNVNSELFGLMNDDELRFVVGHEIGHLMNRDSALKRLLRFVFPKQTDILPLALSNKVHIHDNLAELVADRFGYAACGNLDACITALFKITSGLDLEKMEVSMADLVAENSKHLDYFIKGGGMSFSDHPVIPIRIQAINLFATAKSQKALDEGMDELIGVLLRVGEGPIDGALTQFVATAGLITAELDGKVTNEEMDHILMNLSKTEAFPKNYLKWIQKQDVDELFNQAVNEILNYDPGLKPALLDYIVSVVLADKHIGEKEVNFIYSVGHGMNLSLKEISGIFGSLIQRTFSPSLASIA